MQEATIKCESRQNIEIDLDIFEEVIIRHNDKRYRINVDKFIEMFAEEVKQ